MGINRVYVHDDEDRINASRISKPKSLSRTSNSAMSNRPKSNPTDNEINGQLNKVTTGH